MPYDSNGNYTLPGSYFVENGDTVLPVQHNPPLEDIRSALSSVILRSGVAPMSGDLKMGTKKITGMASGTATTDAVNKGQLDAETLRYVTKAGNYTALASDNAAFIRFTGNATLALTAAAILAPSWWMIVAADGGDVTIDPNASETIDGAATLVVRNGSSALIVCDGTAIFSDKGKPEAVQPFVDMASAATTSIATANSQSVRITGTTTITSLGSATAGTVRLVKFAAALTLTNNANIILPTAANITTVANDVMFAISEGTTIWRILWYRGVLTTANWTTGTSTTPGIPTPAQIAATIAASAVGVGQTLQSFSRLANTAYQNSTTSPIVVMGIVGASSGIITQLSPDNVTYTTVYDHSGGTSRAMVTFIVPPGWYYKSSATFAANVVELR
jgi:hypothetical protein|nr:hypothetical protein [Neorhizobium tomejilense]